MKTFVNSSAYFVAFVLLFAAIGGNPPQGISGGPEFEASVGLQHENGRHKPLSLVPWDQLPPVTFPRAGRSELISPNGRYSIKNVDGYPPRPGELWHTLYLIDSVHNSRSVLYRYGRWVNILWSPSSHALIVNDFYASDDSHCVLFKLKPQISRTDLGEALVRSLKPGAMRDLICSGYPVFKFVVRWRAADSVVLEATGFGDSDETGYHNPFKYLFLYKMEGTTQLYHKSDANSP